jgi:hypothetical protein
MPTTSDLGRRVKAKYPHSYDDLSDDEVGRRVKIKFPGSYDDFTDGGSTTPTAKRRVALSVAQQLVTAGQASPEEIIATFDVVDDRRAAPAPKPKPPAAAEPQSLASRGYDALSYVAPVIPAAVGALKSAGETAANIGSMAHRIPLVGPALDDAARAAGDLFGLNSSGRVSGEEAFDGGKEQLVNQLGLERHGLIEKIGAAGEQAGEAYALGKTKLPGKLGALSPAAALRLKTLAASSPKLAAVLGMGLSGTEQAAANMAQSGLRGDNPLISGAIGLVTPFAGATGEALYGKVAQSDAAQALWSKVLAPNSKSTRVVADRVAGDMADEGAVYMSRKSLGERAAAEKQRLADAIELAHDSKVAEGATIPHADIDSQLEAQIKKMVREKEKTVIVKGVPITFTDEVPLPGKEATVEKLKELRSTFKRLSDQESGTLSYSDVLDSRRSLDQNLARKGIFDLDNARDATPGDIGDYHAANSLRGILNDLNPEASGLHPEYGKWADVDRLMNSPANGAVVRDRTSRTLSPRALATDAFLAHHFVPNIFGDGAGDVATGTLTAAAIMKAARQLMQSTAWRTSSAAIRKRAALLLKEGDVDRAAKLVMQAGAVSADNQEQ